MQFKALKSVALAFLLTGPMAAWPATDPDFPRLGGVLISAPQNYELATYQRQIAKLDVVLLNTWQGWRGYSGSVATLDGVVKNLKSINPAIKVFNYSILEQVGAGQSNLQGFQEQYQKVAAMNWWIYSNGVSGSKVQSSWQGSYGPFYEINLTSFVPVDANGDLWTDWFAKWVVRNFLMPNPSLDGMYLDSVSWFPFASTTGDWNRDGTADATRGATTDQWYRQGYRHYFQKLNALAPGKLQIGNLANWGDPGSTLTEYKGMLNGGVIEGIMGNTWSPEHWGSWQAMMNWYRKTMAAVAAPKLVMFHQNLTPATDYQAMRYGLTSCLLDDGYYAASANDDNHTVAWYDEYDNKLGQATSTPPTAAWQHGVYRRDFAKGIALVNPRGNGPQTVTLESAFKKINGKQAPSVNNGQTVTTVHLNDRDGVILLRVTTQKRPAPVTSIVVQ